MIYVDRSSVPVPDVLSKPGGKGDLERRAVVAFYAIKANRDKVFKKPMAYAHHEVREALKKLFHDKCAFCEIDYVAASWAVEHFRPKGGVDELDLTTMVRAKGTKRVRGYYWLAAEWTNLLPSCTDCNSPRGHGFGEGVRKRTSGKANFFPLQAGCSRAGAPTDGLLAGEQALLLDPTVDQPSVHLKFGEGATIVELSERGRVTIEVLGLRRDGLVRKRQRERLLLLNTIDSIRSAMARLAANPGDAVAEADYNRELGVIQQQYLADTAPFLAMSRQLVREGLGDCRSI